MVKVSGYYLHPFVKARKMGSIKRSGGGVKVELLIILCVRPAEPIKSIRIFPLIPLCLINHSCTFVENAFIFIFNHPTQ